MDNSSWLKELIDKTEHRKKEKFSYLSYLKSKVSIKKLLVTLWVVILFLVVLESLCQLEIISKAFSPILIFHNFIGYIATIYNKFFFKQN